MPFSYIDFLEDINAHDHGTDTGPKTPIFDQTWSSVPEVASLYCILGSGVFYAMAAEG